MKSKVYNIGLLKTGSTSIYSLFQKNYMARHEMKFWDTVDNIHKLQNNIIDKNEFETYIINRNSRKFDVDSSTFNHFYLDILLKDINAKFILTIRNPHDWLKSVLNQFSHYEKRKSKAKCVCGSRQHQHRS